MKIIILQTMYDIIGGIQSVNKSLAKIFSENGYTVYIISLRKSGYDNEVNYPEYCNSILVNESDVWGTIRKREILDSLKKLKLINCIQLIKKRVERKKNLKIDYQKLNKIINDINPDYIINSHYELLDGIPNNYLNKTIMHFHTTFNEVLKLKSYKIYFNKYKDKIYKFVWLSKSTCEEAKKYGYLNSSYVYNPVRIKSNDCADVQENKTIVYLGRISLEKRVDLAIKIFNDISEVFPDWKFKIYTNNDYSELQKNNTNENIIFMGVTNDPVKVYLDSSINIITSSFEGFPMTILEASECGVPTIIFNCSESLQEVISNEEDGIIVEQDNILEFENKLKKMIEDPVFLKKLSLNCKEKNKSFTDDVIFNMWKSLFERK